jgi:hypothetical protein
MQHMARSQGTNTMLEDKALAPRERTVVALPLDPRQPMVEGHPPDLRRPMGLEQEPRRQDRMLRMGAQRPRLRQLQAAMITQEDDS